MRLRLLVAVIACCGAACPSAHAEKTVVICSSPELGLMRIEKDTEGKTLIVVDAALATQDLYPLDQMGPDVLDHFIANMQGDGYRCYPQPPQ